MTNVSVIVVARNEARYIADCLESILREFDLYGLKGEIVVVDGESSDETAAIARKVLGSGGVRWVLLSNPGRTLASGWNVGIKYSTCEYVVRPDAHAALSPGYIVHGLRVLQEKPDVVAVGGSLETRTLTEDKRHFAYALSSKVGVGNSPFRTSRLSQYADTAVYAVYRRQAVVDVGGLNECLVRHQDNDLHEKLRKAGWNFYQSGDMHATYYCRDSRIEIVRQMFAIGRHLPSLWFGSQSGGVKIRHMAPLFFVLALLIDFLVILPIFGLELALLFPAVYVGVLLFEAMYSSLKIRDLARFRTVEIIPVMHVSYGLGTLVGLKEIFFKTDGD